MSGPNLSIPLTIDGRETRVAPGTTVAAAIMNAGLVIRTSVRGEPRSAVCGIGVCHECRANVDGIPHQRTCMIACRAGMRVQTGAVERCSFASTPPDAPPRVISAECIVLGAGPAGLAAAHAFASKRPGAPVVVVDENAAPGGQIWRGSTHAARIAARDTQWFKISHLYSTTVVAAPQPGVLLAETTAGPALDSARPAESRGPVFLRSPRIILATGARELLLPFPGWTLPGVTGVGGLQALVKGGLDIRNKRIVIAGSGPLLLVVALFLARRGARVLGIAEQADRKTLLSFATGLCRWPGKALQAGAIFAELAARRIPIWTGTWISAATPTTPETTARLGTVTLSSDSSTRELACDYAACAYGLVPNTQVAALLGCKLDPGAHGLPHITTDEHMQTSIPGVLAAGECTGIGGVDAAIAEGTLAGLVAAGEADSNATRAARAARRRARAFADRLNTLSAIRPEIIRSASDDDNTILCRCEDVPLSIAAQAVDWREAKTQTRCGMGPCQARICGPAAAVMLASCPAEAPTNPDGSQPPSTTTPRPPAATVRMGTLLAPLPPGDSQSSSPSPQPSSDTPA